MSKTKGMTVNSPIGKRKSDDTGSAVGVVRVDVDKSYADTGELLQDYINQSNEEAWRKIKSKIDYTYECLDLALGPLDGETGFGDCLGNKVDRHQTARTDEVER